MVEEIGGSAMEESGIASPGVDTTGRRGCDDTMHTILNEDPITRQCVSLGGVNVVHKSSDNHPPLVTTIPTPALPPSPPSVAFGFVIVRNDSTFINSSSPLLASASTLKSWTHGVRSTDSRRDELVIDRFGWTQCPFQLRRIASLYSCKQLRT